MLTCNDIIIEKDTLLKGEWWTTHKYDDWVSKNMIGGRHYRKRDYSSRFECVQGIVTAQRLDQGRVRWEVNFHED